MEGPPLSAVIPAVIWKGIALSERSDKELTCGLLAGQQL
jgi:hypothetical protein